MTKEQEEKIDKIVENMSDKEIEDRIRQDEQEEAIERLKRIDVKFFISGMNEVSNYIIDEADKVNNAIETVLNMLKEKDKEIGEIICEQCLLGLDKVDTDTQTLYYLDGEYIGDDNEINEVEEQICDYLGYEQIKED